MNGTRAWGAAGPAHPQTFMLSTAPGADSVLRIHDALVRLDAGVRLRLDPQQRQLHVRTTASRPCVVAALERAGASKATWPGRALEWTGRPGHVRRSLRLAMVPSMQPCGPAALP